MKMKMKKYLLLCPERKLRYCLVSASLHVCLTRGSRTKSAYWQLTKPLLLQRPNMPPDLLLARFGNGHSYTFDSPAFASLGSWNSKLCDLQFISYGNTLLGGTGTQYWPWAPFKHEIFDATYRDPSDVAELSNRRLSALKARDTITSAPVNVNFNGLADIWSIFFLLQLGVSLR